jgi:hypothetical protein
MVLRLDELNEDALRSIFAHVELPHLLKLTCRALRAAGPKRAGFGPKTVAKSVASMRVAHVMRFPLCWNAQFAILVAEAGNLQGFQWWRDGYPNNPERPNRGHIPMNSIVLAAAARSGNLALLQWLVDPSTGLRDIGGAGMHVEMQDGSKAVAMVAARNGHAHILKWMDTLRYAMDFHTVNAAAEWGDYDTFVWLIRTKDNGARQGVAFFAQVLEHAARGSGLRPQGEHRKIMEHLRRMNIEWSPLTFRCSVETATLEMLQWMRSNGCADPQWELTIVSAIQHDRRDVLEWLVRDCGDCYQPNEVWFTRIAAHHGHLELLQWMRAQGCPWDCHAVNEAATAKNVRILRWMAANGAPIYHKQVKLKKLRRELLQSPAGPLIDALVPSAMWVHTLIRWRKVKLAVLRWCVARYWARLVGQTVAQ